MKVSLEKLVQFNLYEDFLYFLFLEYLPTFFASSFCPVHRIISPTLSIRCHLFMTPFILKFVSKYGKI